MGRHLGRMDPVRDVFYESGYAAESGLPEPDALLARADVAVIFGLCVVCHKSVDSLAWAPIYV